MKHLLQQLWENIISITNIHFPTGLTHNIKCPYFCAINTSFPFVVSDVSKQDVFFKGRKEGKKRKEKVIPILDKLFRQNTATKYFPFLPLLLSWCKT